MTRMLQSIGSSLLNTASGRPASSGILQTQLDRFQTQLADWCNCPSGKTADGKKKIAEIQGKADAVKAQLQQIEITRTRQADAAKPAATQAIHAPESSTLGNLVDVRV
jgi:hypothetical protein